MPNLSSMISSRYLRKDDVLDEPVVTIQKFQLEKMPNGREQNERWVLYFKEVRKGLVLNATIIRVLNESFGARDDDCVGKRVQLYVDPTVTFGPAVVGGVRLRPFKPAPPAAVEFGQDIPQ